MKICKFVLYLFSLLIANSCSTPVTNIVNEALFPLPENENLRNLEMSSIDVESFPLDSVESSFLGYMEMDHDTIYLIDKKFCWVFRFTKDGRLIDRQLGLGEGPKEYNTGSIDGYCKLIDGRWGFVDSGDGCTFFTNTFERKNRLQIIRGGTRENKSYSNPAIYTKDYGHFIMRQMGDYLFFNVHAAEAMMSDFMLESETYYRNVHILMKLNMIDGKIENLLGGYPPIYYRKKLYLFQQVSFDLDLEKEQFYVSYDADSLVYCYDKDYKPLYSFGCQGKGMNTNYSTFPMEVLIKQRDKIRFEYSFYHSIKYIKELDLLFRSYTKTPESNCDGLQIYRGQTLIADVDVPRGMTVLGYSAPYVYATTGMDGIRESVDMYRFKLEQ